MEIKEIGKSGLQKRVNNLFTRDSKGIYDQACGVQPSGDGYQLTAVAMMAEGVHFDLVYTPLKHLGYKAVVAALSKITAMNGKAKAISVAVALSSRFSVEATEDLYSGIELATKEHEIEYLGGDITASLTGLTITISAEGWVAKDKIVLNSTAQKGDLICVTGDLGSAYCGLKLLEREKRVLEGNDVAQPEFKGYEYLLRRQLRPQLHSDITVSLEKSSLLPTSMGVVSESFAADLKRLCDASGVGATIYLERIPIATESFTLCEQMNFDPSVAALNGGDDYVLLFTIPATRYDDITSIVGINVIGHTTAEGDLMLATPDGGVINITAPGI